MTKPGDQPTPRPRALVAEEAPARQIPSAYPSPFAEQMAGRTKQPLARPFGLSQFGVNRTTLAPGARSALFHAHSRQEEFLYVLAGTPCLRLGEDNVRLAPGMVAGFPPGLPHQVINDTSLPVVILEVGTCPPDDECRYPEDDLEASWTPAGGWRFTHRDGTPW